MFLRTNVSGRTRNQKSYSPHPPHLTTPIRIAHRFAEPARQRPLNILFTMSASIQIVGGKHPKVTDVQGNGLENVGLEMTTAPEGTNGVDVTDVAFSSGHNMGSGNANDKAERAARYPPGASTSVGAVANFVNTIVGAGIVGLPFALAEVRLCFFPSCRSFLSIELIVY